MVSVKENAVFEFPRVIAWELTRRCPLKCTHCRASACDVRLEHELDTSECLKIIDSIGASRKHPMLIFTGGEPMTRPDLVQLVRHAKSMDLRVVMAPCGMLVTQERLQELVEAGVSAFSFSLDGYDKVSHDTFRGVDGAYEHVISAMRAAKCIGVPFQANITVSKLSRPHLSQIAKNAIDEGASRLDFFFLVPVGRGAGIADLALSPEETRETLSWIMGLKVPAKATCCPSGPTGCLGGRGFAFLSHIGELQTCGFVDVPLGNIRDYNFDFVALCRSAINPLGTHGNCRIYYNKKDKTDSEVEI